MNETRINKLVNLFIQLTAQGGAHEQTKVLPNREIIDATPTGMADYVIVEDEGGYYLPAVKLPGIAYADGDLVNVFIIQGTEPIAFQHGSGSTGGGTTNTVRITNADTPYTALATDEVIFADTDGGAITVNFPAGVEGKHYKVANCGSSGNDVTVDGNAAETVYGAATQTLSDGEVIEVHFNATENWW